MIPYVHNEIDLFEEVERVPVIGYEVLGRRISVTLDRPVRKRCEFLVLGKPYRDREDSKVRAMSAF